MAGGSGNVGLFGKGGAVRLEGFKNYRAAVDALAP